MMLFNLGGNSKVSYIAFMFLFGGPGRATVRVNGPHVYRHALRGKGEVGRASPYDLPADYHVVRREKEGLARLRPSSWWAVNSSWTLLFDGAIRRTDRLHAWQLNDLLIIDVAGRRRAFLELRTRVKPHLRDRFRLIELLFESSSHPGAEVDRVTLAPLRFDLAALTRDRREFHVYGDGLEVHNDVLPSELIDATESAPDERITLIPADYIGQDRIKRFLLKHDISVDAPKFAAPCARRLHLVR